MTEAVIHDGGDAVADAVTGKGGGCSQLMMMKFLQLKQLLGVFFLRLKQSMILRGKREGRIPSMAMSENDE